MKRKSRRLFDKTGKTNLNQVDSGLETHWPNASSFSCVVMNDPEKRKPQSISLFPSHQLGDRKFSGNNFVCVKSISKYAFSLPSQDSWAWSGSAAVGVCPPSGPAWHHHASEHRGCLHHTLWTQTQRQEKRELKSPQQIWIDDSNQTQHLRSPTPASAPTLECHYSVVIRFSEQALISTQINTCNHSNLERQRDKLRYARHRKSMS